jgi:hypothetical protein
MHSAVPIVLRRELTTLIQLLRRNIGNESLPCTITTILIRDIVVVHLLLPISKLDWW